MMALRSLAARQLPTSWATSFVRRANLTGMRQLLLLRHAKSSWDDPKLSDHARPLNQRGHRAAQSMARAMRDLGLTPDLVLVSSARRTLQTLEALEPWDETPLIEPMDALYLAPASDMLDVLRRTTPAVRSLLLVGHNPGLHELAVTLAGINPASLDERVRGLAEGYPSGSLAEFTIVTPWSELREGGGRLMRFLRPIDLAETSA
jgi:phosphohistidine phosphatase